MYQSQIPTPIDWSGVAPLPPVTDAESFFSNEKCDYMELVDVKTGARYIAKIVDVKFEKL
jgi:hypothetical protein